jgi:hypothetical protein
VNIVQVDPWSNQSSLTISSEILPKNIIIATLEEVLEDACKASKEHWMDAEEGCWDKRAPGIPCLLHERPVRHGHVSEESCSTASRQRSQGNTQCGHIIPLDFLWGCFQHVCWSLLNIVQHEYHEWHPFREIQRGALGRWLAESVRRERVVANTNE